MSLCKYNFQLSDKRYFYLSAFSNNSLQAYIACLDNSHRNIYIVPSTGAAAAQDFTISVRLRDFPGNPEMPVVAKVVAGGAIHSQPAGWRLSSDRSAASGTMHPNDEVPIAVTRDTNVAFEFDVEVGKDNPRTEIMRLGPAPAFKLVEENRYGDVYASDCEECFNESHQDGTLAINVGNDEVIVPRSEFIYFGQDGSSPGYSPLGSRYAFDNLNAGDYSKAYNPRSVGIPVHVNTAPHPHGTVWCGRWLLAVKVLVAIPVSAEKSGKEQPLPSVACTRPQRR